MGWPGSTASPSVTSILTMVPLASASISFISCGQAGGGTQRAHVGRRRCRQPKINHDVLHPTFCSARSAAHATFVQRTVGSMPRTASAVAGAAARRGTVQAGRLLPTRDCTHPNDARRSSSQEVTKTNLHCFHDADGLALGHAVALLHGTRPRTGWVRDARDAALRCTPCRAARGKHTVHPRYHRATQPSVSKAAAQRQPSTAP